MGLGEPGQPKSRNKRGNGAESTIFIPSAPLSSAGVDPNVGMLWSGCPIVYTHGSAISLNTPLGECCVLFFITTSSYHLSLPLLNVLLLFYITACPYHN